MAILAHRIALDPTVAQQTQLAQSCGVARFAWNWALAEWRRQYAAGGKPSEAALRRQLNAIKRQEFPWMLDVPKRAPQQAIMDLGTAFRRFFAGQARYPRFKKKGVRDSYRADNGPQKAGDNAVRVDGKRIRLPKIGWVQMRQALRFEGRIVSAVVSRTADRWFVSLAVEIDYLAPVRKNQAAVGVDLGVANLATLSTGEVVAGPMALRSDLARLRRLSRALSRKRPGSRNRAKARMRLARLQARIANVRAEALHKLTTDLVRRFAAIGIEDLNVRGMMANRHLARAIGDCGFHEFRRQLAYKAELFGARIVVADRWYPSSRTCAACGHVVAGLPLSVRAWTCPACGDRHDRDLNAAKNLEKLAASSAVTACGAEGADDRPVPGVKPAAMKQEPDIYLKSEVTHVL